MIGLLILAQKDIGKGLLAAVEHVFGSLPPQLQAMPVSYDEPPERLSADLERRIENMDQGDGVLVLSDIYGATHTNVACRLLRPGAVELIAGINLPMLIRVLNYRHLNLTKLVEKALSGGPEGIVCPNDDTRTVERRR